MPSPIITLDLIKRAMQLIGAIEGNETPDADEARDGLAALNDVLETWSIQSLAVYGSLPEPFTTVAGQSTYTVGPGGNWNTDRPANITSAYTTVQGVDFPIGMWTQDQYDAVAVKYQRQQIVERMVFVNDGPFAQVILYPTPSDAVTVTINAPRILTQIADTATILSLPPGYARALQYAVAVELMPQYGSPTDVTGQARAMLAYIKRANRTTPVSDFDAMLIGGGRVVPARGY